MDAASYLILSVRVIQSRVNDGQLGTDYIKYVHKLPGLGMGSADLIHEIKEKLKEGK